jgi:hypothetical protein
MKAATIERIQKYIIAVLVISFIGGLIHFLSTGCLCNAEISKDEYTEINSLGTTLERRAVIGMFLEDNKITDNEYYEIKEIIDSLECQKIKDALLEDKNEY